MLCTAWNHPCVMTVQVMNTAKVGDLLHVPYRCPLLTCWHAMVPIPNLLHVCQCGRGKGEMGLLFSIIIHAYVCIPN